MVYTGLYSIGQWSVITLEHSPEHSDIYIYLTHNPTTLTPHVNPDIQFFGFVKLFECIPVFLILPDPIYRCRSYYHDYMRLQQLLKSWACECRPLESNVESQKHFKHAILKVMNCTHFSKYFECLSKYVARIDQV